MNKKDLVLIDELSHASTFLGAKLSGSHVIQFKHNNVEDLEKHFINLEINMINV